LRDFRVNLLGLFNAGRYADLETLAQTWLRFAWKARGHGYGNTVTPEAWELFEDRVRSARSTKSKAAFDVARTGGWDADVDQVAADDARIR